MSEGPSISLVTEKKRGQTIHSLQLYGMDGSLEDEVVLTGGSHSIVDLAVGLSNDLARPIFKSDEFPGDPLARRDAVLPLARLGWDFLAAIAGEEGRTKILRFVARIPEGETILVIQGCAWIPWGLIYTVDPSITVKSDAFLGARNLLIEPVEEDRLLSEDADVGEPMVDFERFAYGFVDDDSLTAVGVERAEFKKVAALCDPLTEANDPSRSPLRPSPFEPGREPANPPQFAEDLARYAEYVARGWTALHFAVHGALWRRDTLTYVMTVSSGFEHLFSALEAKMQDYKGAKLTFAFFNACLSGADNNALERAPAAQFRRRGVDATIGTNTEICDFVAARFSALFYGLALRDRLPVGEAFAEARRRLLDETGGNPAALVYSLYGHPSTRLCE